MSKKIADYTLGEVQELCKERYEKAGCPNCPVNKFCLTNYEHAEAPCAWNLSDPPKWTTEEMERAKAIKVLWPNAKTIRNDTATITIEWFKDLGSIKTCGTVFLSKSQFPSLQPGETVTLEEIINAETE